MKLKQKFIDWLIVVWLIILTLCLIIRVEPNFVNSQESYMSVFVTAIGTVVAIIIGFQIINVLDIKDILRKMRNDYQQFQEKTNNSLSEFKKSNTDFRDEILKKETQLENSINNTVARIHSLQASVREGITVLDALRIAEDHSYFSNHFDAFVRMNEALLYALDYDSPNYSFILDKMREYAMMIRTQTFNNGPILKNDRNLCFYHSDADPTSYRKLSDFVNSDVLPIVKDTEEKIKVHPKFTCISHDYSVLMGKFYNRVNRCVKGIFPQTHDELNDF